MPSEATRQAAIVEQAARSEGLRRYVVSEAEVLDAISPATPDRVVILDEERSVFRAEWWTGNADAARVAGDDIAALVAAEGVVTLSEAAPSEDDEEFVCIYFYLAFTDELVSDLDN